MEGMEYRAVGAMSEDVYFGLMGVLMMMLGAERTLEALYMLGTLAGHILVVHSWTLTCS
jgi:hypothetical protein